jgi:hypothetical protein
VGKTGRCACGKIMKVPSRPTTGPVPATPPPLPAARPSPRLADAPAGMPAFLRMPEVPTPGDDRVLDAQTEAELRETGAYGEEDAAKPDLRRDYHVPLAMLAIGVIVTFIDLNVGGAFGAVVAAVGTVIKLVVWSAIFTAGAMLAVWLAGINLGPVWPGALKLAAVSVGPSALGDLVTHLLGGDMAVGIIGGTLGVVVCWAMMSYLFRLDGGQTMTVVGAIVGVKMVLMLVLGGLFMAVLAGLGPEPIDLAEMPDDEPGLMQIDDDLLTADADEGDSSWDD